MENLTNQLSEIAVALVALAFLWLIGGGVLPLLKSLTDLANEKKAMLTKGIESIDSHFANDGNGYVSCIVHEIADGAELTATMPGVILTANTLTEAFKVFHKILPEVPGEVEPEVVARVGNEVFDFAARLTDKIEGNAHLPEALG